MIDAAGLFLLALVRHALWGTEKGPGADGDVDWVRVYDLASEHGVLAVSWDAVEGLGLDASMPVEVKVPWAYNARQTEANYGRQAAVIEKLACLYNRHGIDMTVLKGYGLSLCWPTPCHRPCGDVDIWLGGRHDEGNALVCAEWGTEIDDSHHHHTVFYVNGVMVENHYDFVNVHAHGSSRAVERELRRLAGSGAEPVKVGAGRIYLPPATCAAVFMLRHAAAHFAAERILLRHLIDWAVFIACKADDIDWHEVERIAGDTGMRDFLHCLDAIAVDYIGLDAGKVPQAVCDEPLEMRVISDILRPEFSERMPRKGAARIILFKTRRWWRNRWKHELVYGDNLVSAFVRSAWSHVLKPKSITG